MFTLEEQEDERYFISGLNIDLTGHMHTMCVTDAKSNKKRYFLFDDSDLQTIYDLTEMQRKSQQDRDAMILFFELVARLINRLKPA